MTRSVVEARLTGTTAVLLLVAPLLFTDIVTLLVFLVWEMVCLYIGSSRLITGTCRGSLIFRCSNFGVIFRWPLCKT